MQPKEEANTSQTATRYLLTAAAAVIIIASLKLAQGLFVPILLAAFIATVSFPITDWLRSHRVPRFFAVLLTVLVDFAFLTGIILIGISLAGDLQNKWKGENGEPGYESLMWDKLQQGTESINATLQAWGFEEATVNIDLKETLAPVILPATPTDAILTPAANNANAVTPTTGTAEPSPTTDPALKPAPSNLPVADPLLMPAAELTLLESFQKKIFSSYLGQILDYSTNIAFAILSFLATTLLVLILTVFMLTEARMFARQAEAVCEAKGPNLVRLLDAARDVQRYLAIKTLISLATGILAGFLCWAAGLDFYVLWGILAFALNFVPVVGSIIAGLPPVILALLVEDGPSAAIAVMIGFASINIFLGNFLEPMLMGRRFGLSTLIVLIAVLFWGWLWGPIGMLLAVPLTMVIRAGLDHSDEFRWLAIAISKEKKNVIIHPRQEDDSDSDSDPTSLGMNKPATDTPS